MGTSLFPENKVARHGIDHPPLSQAKVRERVDLYLYSPSGISCPVRVWPVGFMLETKYSNANFQDKLICFPDVVLDSIFSLEDLLYIRTDVII